VIAGNLADSMETYLFTDEFKSLSWDALSAYFKNRQSVSYFPLSQGKPKHVKNAVNILANEFDFNNEKHHLGNDFDWLTNPSKDQEWLILLHKFYYFKDLAGAYDFSKDERYAQKWITLIESWIAQVPDGFIDSQVTGRRLQQWILSYHYVVTKGQSTTVKPDFFERLMRSINSQTHHLCTNLTPEGNHRTLELYAIFLVAVTFPELSSAYFFLTFSKQKLIENIQQDLLPDGVHRELSTDYHHTVLKNYLRFRELATLNKIELPAICDTLLKRAIEFSIYVHKPDGFIPAINDGDCNSYLSLLNKAYACCPDDYLKFVLSKGEKGKAPSQRSRGFVDSGYYILRSDWTAKSFEDALYLFFDCAPVGFGSHGHYDALNFEMAAYGRSLIVDPGRYTYCEDSDDGINWRRIFKGTAAHNTVVIDGLDQMPYRAGRPVDKESVTTLKQFVSAVGFDLLHGQVISHQYPAVHDRIIFFLQPEYWIITDLLSAKSTHSYDLYFHLASQAQDQTELYVNDQCNLVQSPNLLIAQAKDIATSVTIEQGYVSPEYGIKHKAPVVRFSKHHAKTTAFHTVIYPYKHIKPTLQITQIPVYQNDRLCEVTKASALQINLTNNQNTYIDTFFYNPAATGTKYDFADVHCDCRMLFIRRNSYGEIINFQAEGASFITLDDKNVLNFAMAALTISYQNQHLSISTSKKALTTQLDKFENLHKLDGLAAWWMEINNGNW
jgi:Heparinase II/III N-terminus/Heparinase II/III-like protein